MTYARRGFPFTEKQLCILAYEMAVRDGKKGFSPIKQKAGRSWLKKGFFKRHPEVRRKTAVNLNIARAISANPGQIAKFFNDYQEWLDQWGLEFSPNRIWNVDECGCRDVPKPQSVVGVTGEWTCQTVSGEKPENTTVVTYVSAGGLVLPPMVIFKTSKVKKEWREAAPSGYFVSGSTWGYINANLFNEYGEQFVKFIKENKILVNDQKVMVLLDMQKSYLFNLDFMTYMKVNNVEVCSFPPHCTHLLQPLDDIPYAQFKSEYQRQLMHMNRVLCGNKMTRIQFFRVLVPAFGVGMIPEAIRRGFKNTGILPVNSNTEKLKLLGPSQVFDRCKSLYGLVRVMFHWCLVFNCFGLNGLVWMCIVHHKWVIQVGN